MTVTLFICPMTLIHAVLPSSTCSVASLGLLFHQDSPDSLLPILKSSCIANHTCGFLGLPLLTCGWSLREEHKSIQSTPRQLQTRDEQPLPCASLPGVLHAQLPGSQLTCWDSSLLPSLLETPLRNCLISKAGWHLETILALCRSCSSF